MCDKDPTCEHAGSHSEFVAGLLGIVFEQAEYEGRDMEGAEDLVDLLNAAVKRYTIQGEVEMTELVKSDGIWWLFSGNERRHPCDACNHMSYNWKDFDIHRKTHTFEELDKALWIAVDAKIRIHSKNLTRPYG